MRFLALITGSFTIQMRGTKTNTLIFQERLRGTEMNQDTGETKGTPSCQDEKN